MMHTKKQLHSRIRRGLAFLGFAAMLGLAMAALSQCRMVQDSVTGVDFKTASDAHARNDCVRKCNETFKQERAKEEVQFEENLKSCDGNKACIKAAKQAHRDVLDGLRARKRECKRSCYNEGSGAAGR